MGDFVRRERHLDDGDHNAKGRHQHERKATFPSRRIEIGAVPMRSMAAIALALLLTACGEDEAEIAADYKTIAEATCFLSGYDSDTSKYEKCVTLISASLGAQRRRNAAVERTIAQQNMTEEIAKNVAENVSKAIQEHRATNQEGSMHYPGR